MALNPEIKAAMRRMFYVEHHTINAIGAHFSAHHTTVKKVLHQNFPRTQAARVSEHKLLIADHVRTIEDILANRPRISAIRILKTLKTQGYSGSYNTVVRAVKKYRPRYHRSYVHVSVIPGEEAQVDWAHAGKIVVGDATRKLYCFVMTLSWSRASWVQLTLDMETETLLRCHEAAFNYFGGVPRRILYDNMKTVVIDRSGDFVRFNSSFLEFSSWHCFEPRVCDPYQPNQKGKVERFIRTLRDGFLTDSNYSDLEEFRYQLRLWLEAVNYRPWPDGKHTTVRECWEKEKNCLLAHSSPTTPMGRREVRSTKTSLVNFDLNSYSINPKFVRLPLVLWYNDHEIKLFSGEICVGHHQRCWDRNRVVKLPEHIEASYAIASEGQKSASQRQLLFDEVPQVREVMAFCQQADISLYQLERGLLRLKSTYGIPILTEAIQEAIFRKVATIEGITQITLRLASDLKLSNTPNLLLNHRPGVSDLIISSHSLSEYDQL